MFGIRDLSFVGARLVVAVLLLPWALDWRSPLLASVRYWALAGLVLLPLGLIVVAIRTLRRDGVSHTVHVFNAISCLAAALCLACVLSSEVRFQWMRYTVLHADPAQLEKLGRHLVVGYRDGDELTALIDRRAIAGVFLTARNVKGRDAQSVRRAIAAMQEIRRKQGVPRLIVATDQEGGGVSRLSPPLTWLPSLSEIVARTPDAVERRKAVQAYAATQARELADLGVVVNFAPVVDVNHGVFNPDDRLTRIQTRAIASDPLVVADVADAYCSQLSAHGVNCTLKHFPGLGRVFEDTHLRSADLAAGPDELAASDWIPFRSLMSRPDILIMLSHVRLLAVDRDHPVSFSQAVVGDMLRRDWGFGGVLITDDFSMGAVYRSPEGISGGSIAALNAGVDLILFAYDADQVYVAMYALIQAERDGLLEGAKLDRSGARLRQTFDR